MNRLKRPLSETQMPLLLAGSALLVLVIIIVVFLTGGSDDADRLMRLENTVRLLETRIQEMESDLARFQEQDSVIETLINKVDLIDDSVPERFDALEKQMANLQQQLTGSAGKPDTESPPETTAAKEEQGKSASSTEKPPVKRPTTPKSKVDYHQVKTGETLYQISRRYDLSVAELRRLNNLKEGDLIRPGQKLVVSGRGR